MAFGPTGKGARLGSMFAAGMASAGMKQARDDLDAGFNQAKEFTAAGQGYLTPVFGQSMRGMGAYADRAGVNGADGQARAMSDFNNSIYGRAGEDYGVQGVQRSAAGMGLSGSGNAMAALGEFLQKNRAQNYTTFTNLASPYNSMALQAGGSLASQQQGLGSLAAQIAAQKASAAQQGYQSVGNAGGSALAVGDQVQQQRTNIGMQLGQAGLQLALGMMGGMGGIPGMGGAGGPLSSAMSTLGGAFGGGGGIPSFSGGGPILPGYSGSPMSGTGGLF